MDAENIIATFSYGDFIAFVTNDPTYAAPPSLVKTSTRRVQLFRLEQVPHNLQTWDAHALFRLLEEVERYLEGPQDTEEPEEPTADTDSQGFPWLKPLRKAKKTVTSSAS